MVSFIGSRIRGSGQVSPKGREEGKEGRGDGVPSSGWSRSAYEPIFSSK